jgi:hypothetical protein
MLSKLVKPAVGIMCRLRVLPERRRLLLGLGGILGIASLIAAIGTIRALPVLRRNRSQH